MIHHVKRLDGWRANYPTEMSDTTLEGGVSDPEVTVPPPIPEAGG